jgi:hypothetical protein
MTPPPLSALNGHELKWPDPSTIRWNRGLFEMVLAALVIFALPFLYLSFLVAFGLFLVIHGDIGIEDYMLGHGPVWLAIVRLIAVSLGAGWWLLMFKPLLARNPQKPASQLLKKVAQGDLFEVITTICQLTGAPIPNEVRVNCDMAVKVSLTRGLWSILPQKTTLTLGLPLVVSGTMNEFVGALANELGRYPQGLYGRLAHLVNIVNHWLSWVALNLDSWQTALASGEAVKVKKLSVVVKGWRGFVWVSQRPIWVVMWVARLASIRPHRRSVLNGDRCEALLVGSVIAVQSLQKKPHFQSAWRQAIRNVQLGLSSGRLPDNFPQAVARQAASKEAISSSINEWEVGSLFVPSASVRGKVLMKLGLPPCFEKDGSGGALFCDATELCRQATQLHYQQDLHLSMNQFRLVAADESVDQKQKHEAMVPVNRYFKGLLHPLRALCGDGGGNAPSSTMGSGLDAYRHAISEGLTWMKNRGDQMRVNLREWQSSWQRVRDLEMAHAFALAGLPMDSHQYGVVRHDAELYREEIKKQELVCECSADPLLVDEGRLESRFAAALGLLWETPAEKLPDGLVTLRKTLPALADLYQTLGGRMAAMRGLVTLAGAFDALGTRFGVGDTESGPFLAVRFLLPRLMHHTQQVVKGLDRVPCPESVVNGGPHLAHHLLGNLTAERMALVSADWSRCNPEAIGIQEASLVSELVAPMMDRFMALYHQTFSALTSAAELAELHLIEAYSEEFYAEETKQPPLRRQPSGMLAPSMA